MKKISLIVTFIVILITIESCVTHKIQKKTPAKKSKAKIEKTTKEKPIEFIALNDTLRTKYGLDFEKLKKIQLANGPNGQYIILKRQYIESIDTIINGKLMIHNINKIDIVKIKPFTKGKMIYSSPKKIGVTFNGNDELFLVFYADKDGNYFLYDYLKNNHILYNKKLYEIISNGQLYINLEQLTDTEVNENIAPGSEVK